MEGRGEEEMMKRRREGEKDIKREKRECEKEEWWRRGEVVRMRRNISPWLFVCLSLSVFL